MNTSAITTIEELENTKAILEIQDGNHGERHPVAVDYVNTGIPFIMAKDILNSKVDIDNCMHISKAQADNLRTGFSISGDVLLTHKGTIGKSAVVPIIKGYLMLTPQVTYYRVDNSKLNNLYLSYAFQDPWFQARLHQLSSQSTRPYIGIQAQRNLRIRIHPLTTQKQIASILSIYDDLIENNLRRIKILEKMAQNLYREWFVKFRFPGYEKVRFVDSPLGKIPEGWDTACISDIASVYRGRSYRSKELVVDGGLPFINLKCIERDGGFRRDGVKRYIGPYKPRHIVHSGDIVMAVTDMTQERRIVARAARVPTLDSEHGVISMDLIHVKPKENSVSTEFMYSYFRYSEFADNVKQYANGANVLHLSPDRIDEHVIALPPDHIREHFDRIASPISQTVENWHKRNEILRQTRDLLLPKLISGELDVSDLDIDIPKETA